MKMTLTMEKVKEYSSLLWLNFRVSLRNLFDNLSTALNYYPTARFAKIDLALLWSYLFNNPFRISKRFLEKAKAEDVYAYGETPLTTFEQVLKACDVKKSDVFYELGCGRGRTCFWANAFIECKTVGIEFIPEFVDKANKLVKQFDLKDIEFRCEDMVDSKMSDATVVYLYGTCLDDETIKKMEQKFSKLPSGTKIVTVSYSLNSYAPDRRYEVMKRFPARFTWGKGDVYLNIRK